MSLSDSVRARIVAFKDDRDGYTKNTFTNGTEANDADDWGIRGHLDIDLSDNASLLLSGVIVESGGVGTKAELREPYHSRTY